MAAYLRLLMHNRLAVFKSGSYAKEGKSKLIAVLKAVGLALLMLVLYASVAFVECMLFSLLHGIGQGQTAIGLALLAFTMFTLIYGFFHVNGMLFFGKDMSFLAALPISSRSVLTGKMLSILTGEAGVTLLFSAPLIIAHGITSGAGVAYYVKSVLAFALCPVLPLVIGMLLSFALIRISGLWKRREGVTTILAVLLFIGILLAELSLQSVSEEELTRWMLSLFVGQGSLTSLLLRNIPWLQWANDGVLTAGLGGWLMIGLFALVSLGIAVLAIWLLGGGYMGLAIRQSEAIGQVNRGKKRAGGHHGQRSPVVAILWQEVRDVLSVPVYATNCLIGMIVMPVMIIGAALSGSEGSSLKEITMLLALVPKGAYLAVATGVFGLMGAMCEAASTAVSREGKSHELRKTYPVSGALQLRAKVYMGLLFHAAGVLLLAIPLCFLLPAFWQYTLVAAVCSLPVTYLLSIVGVIIDVHNPKLNWKTETEAVKQNFNAMIAMLVCLVAVALLVGAFLLLMKWKLGWYGSFAVTMLLSLALDALALLWLNRFGEKAYFAH